MESENFHNLSPINPAKFRNPPILLFDDPTSELDAEEEKVIKNSGQS